MESENPFSLQSVSDFPEICPSECRFLKRNWDTGFYPDWLVKILFWGRNWYCSRFRVILKKGNGRFDLFLAPRPDPFLGRCVACVLEFQGPESSTRRQEFEKTIERLSHLGLVGRSLAFWWKMKWN